MLQGNRDRAGWKQQACGVLGPWGETLKQRCACRGWGLLAASHRRGQRPAGLQREPEHCVVAGVTHASAKATQVLKLGQPLKVRDPAFLTPHGPAIGYRWERALPLDTAAPFGRGLFLGRNSAVSHGRQQSQRPGHVGLVQRGLHYTQF